jgi:hypothetical protein|nr:MAG TPA: Protein of unknown function (DUF551) [Caudoviricetes sp.]
MRTPEEIKKGLEICRGKCTGNKPHCPYDKYVNGCEDALNRDALAYIQQLEARMEAFADEALTYIQQLEAQQPRWISVGERLPEDDGYFLCNRNDGSPDVVCMYYGDGDFLTPEPELNNISNVITHWMPLPQSPEEE